MSLLFILDQLVEYYKGSKIIKEIKQNYNKLNKLKIKIDKKSAYLFPESVISESSFVNILETLIASEQNQEYKKLFKSIKDLFVESMA